MKKTDQEIKFLLFVGSLVKVKWIIYLIQAIPLIIKDFPDAKLPVAGDGHLKDELMDLVNKLNIPTKVIFAGSIPNDELPTFYASADIFILPSFSKG